MTVGRARPVRAGPVRVGLVRATAIGTALQLEMVVAGHFVPAVAAYFALGGMGFSALSGWLSARGGGGWGAALAGGALAGGLCAAIGIGVSVLLGDVPATLLAFGTAASVVTGVIGAAIARAFGRG